MSFDPHTRSGDPDTSHKAARKLGPVMNQLRAIVLHAFVERERMTDRDLENRFNNPGSTYRSRRSELTQMGLLCDSGQRRDEADEGTCAIHEVEVAS
jgi:hypothetical protein